MEAKPQIPSIGRVVHYNAYGTPGGEFKPEPRAAIITQVSARAAETGEGEVGLAVLNPHGLFFNPSVPFSPEPMPGHWNWPPRV